MSVRLLFTRSGNKVDVISSASEHLRVRMSSNNANRRAKMEKEREKQVQDRLQVLICEMLKDEDNKYCVDCDSKGSS